MAKSIASNKPKDTGRTVKARARKIPPKVAAAAKTTPTKVSPTKAAIKRNTKDAQRGATKAARKTPQEIKGNGQAAVRLKAIRIKQTKSQIMQTITEETGLPRKDVARVMATLATLAKRHVMKRGSGEFAIPELGVKVRRVQRKARMARNPMTGEAVRVPAKTAVKATVLKALKDAVL